MSYQSARDLPSFVQLAEQIEMIKALDPTGERTDWQRLETQVVDLAAVIDRFYEVFGPRNWVYHELLSVEKVRAILDAGTSVEDAEQALMTLYDREFLRLAIQLSTKIDVVKARRALLDTAYDDYFARRYYSCVFLLLSVADGFVNDLNSPRRGLHARKSEEMSAWDSVISHHQGIGRVHRAVYRSVSKTVSQPVADLYRHGIMHGMTLDFNNQVVAAKAWNFFFAVVDWANARTKAAKPVPPPPTVEELADRAEELYRDREILAAWSPVTLSLGDDGFDEDEAVIACNAFLEAWQSRNIGRMASFLTVQMAAKHGGGLPLVVRKRFDSYKLSSDYFIAKVDHTAASVRTVEVALTINDGDPEAVQLRWLYQGVGSDLAMPAKGNGMWKLDEWGPATFLSRSRARSSG